MPSVPDPDHSSTYCEIARRLQGFRPAIILKDHIKPGTLSASSSILEGIAFVPNNFQSILAAFRDCHTERGEKAFDYYPMPASKLRKFASSAASLDFLSVSYLATDGWGFREIRTVMQLDDRPLSRADASGGRDAPLWDKKFGARFGADGTGDKAGDMTSIHAALSPDGCSIHIDNVGFVLRGLDGGGGMGPDFFQHLVDELVWKTYLAPHLSPWLGNHLTVNLPSSKTNYAPMAGLTLDLPDEGLSISATVTLGCGCLPAKRTQLDYTATIPEGFSVGVGVSKSIDWFGGGRR